jgi:hypothetical protein
LLYLIRPFLWTAMSLVLGSGMVAAVGLSSPGTSSYSGAATSEGPALAPALTPASPLPGDAADQVPRASTHRSASTGRSPADAQRVGGRSVSPPKQAPRLARTHDAPRPRGRHEDGHEPGDDDVRQRMAQQICARYGIDPGSCG